MITKVSGKVVDLYEDAIILQTQKGITAITKFQQLPQVEKEKTYVFRRVSEERYFHKILYTATPYTTVEPSSEYIDTTTQWQYDKITDIRENELACITLALLEKQKTAKGFWRLRSCDRDGNVATVLVREKHLPPTIPSFFTVKGVIKKDSTLFDTPAVYFEAATPFNTEFTGTIISTSPPIIIHTENFAHIRGNLPEKFDIGDTIRISRHIFVRDTFLPYIRLLRDSPIYKITEKVRVPWATLRTVEHQFNDIPTLVCCVPSHAYFSISERCERCGAVCTCKNPQRTPSAKIYFTITDFTGHRTVVLSQFFTQHLIGNTGYHDADTLSATIEKITNSLRNRTCIALLTKKYGSMSLCEMLRIITEKDLELFK